MFTLLSGTSQFGNGAGRWLIAAACAAMAVPSGAAWAQAQPAKPQMNVDKSVFTAPPPKPAQPDLPPPPVQIMLVQSTIAALNDANLVNDYSVFLKLSSAGFQQANSPAQMTAAFKAFRDNRVNLAPGMLYLPRWQYSPTLQQGALRLVGAVPTRPEEIGFDMTFVPENGIWKLADLHVGLRKPDAADGKAAP